MANGKITLGKQSGGTLGLVFPDGVSNTEVVVPESGTLVSVGTTVTDNAIVRFDGTTGQVQNSGVVIDDSGSLNAASGSILLGYDSSNAQILGLNTDVIYGSTGYFATKFYNNGAEIMRINSNGNILVGTTTDNGVDKLQVNGSISSGSIKQYNSGDLNNFKYITQTIGTYPALLNQPVLDHGYLEVIVYSPNYYVMQRWTTLGVGQTAGRIFVRCCVNGTWTAWVEK